MTNANIAATVAGILACLFITFIILAIRYTDDVHTTIAQDWAAFSKLLRGMLPSRRRLRDAMRRRNRGRHAKAQVAA